MDVLLAADGTVESDIAEAMICRICPPQSTTVHAVHVVDTPLRETVFTGWMAQNADAGAEAHRTAIQVAEKTLDSIAARLSGRGFTVETNVLTGPVSEQILGEIKRRNPDVVAAGSGGKNSLEALLLGSVSRKLVLYSESSILIGRHPRGSKHEETPPERLDTKPLSVLVAVDGQDGADLAVQSLSGFSTPLFDQAFTLCVEPVTAIPMGVDTFFYAKMFEEGLDACREIARHAAERIEGCARRVTPLCEIGRPSHIIAKKAEETGADLIVMGASRHGSLERFFMGSCAYETANIAPCSVLILRDPLPLSGASTAS